MTVSKTLVLFNFHWPTLLLLGLSCSLVFYFPRCIEHHLCFLPSNFKAYRREREDQEQKQEDSFHFLCFVEKSISQEDFARHLCLGNKGRRRRKKKLHAKFFLLVS